MVTLFGENVKPDVVTVTSHGGGLGAVVWACPEPAYSVSSSSAVDTASTAFCKVVGRVHARTHVVRWYHNMSL
jgi:hypothetical protein